MASEDILGSPDILVEAEKDCSLRVGPVAVGVVPSFGAVGLGWLEGWRTLGRCLVASRLLLSVQFRDGGLQDSVPAYEQIIPGRWEQPQQRSIVTDFILENGPESVTFLLRAIRTRDDVVETAVQNNLHATIDLGSCNGSRLDLICYTGMNPSLQLLS